MPSRRRLARIAVVQTLFELEFPEGRTQVSSEILWRSIDELGREHVDVHLAQAILEGVLQQKEHICAAVQEHAPQWPLARMDRISRILLMIGTFELLFTEDAPPAVVMDEAIEIAKEYGEEESAKFVNGVLNAIAHTQ